LTEAISSVLDIRVEIVESEQLSEINLQEHTLYLERVFVYDTEQFGRVVQWLERIPDKNEAVGSIPTAPTRAKEKMFNQVSWKHIGEAL
jgi:hypothetical protein